MSDLAQLAESVPLTLWLATRRLPRLPQVSRALQAVAGHHHRRGLAALDVALRGTVEAAVAGLIKPTLIATRPR